MSARFSMVYPMRAKSEVLQHFISFRTYIEASSDTRVKILRSENGGACTSKDLQTYCEKTGVAQQLTVPYNPEQNGMSERLNRTLVEMARCMLKESGLGKQYWTEAVVTAADVRNTIPSAGRIKSLYEQLYKRRPQFERMRFFGCVAARTDNHGDQGQLVAYPAEPHGKSDVLMERSQDSAIVPWTPPLSILPVLTQLSSTPGCDGEDEFNIRSVRKRREVVRYQDEFQRPFQLDDDEATHAALFCLVAETADESVTTYKEILRSPNCSQWQQAMKAEINYLRSYRTWRLVQLPAGKKPIGYCWLFKVKRNADGTVNRYEAR
ncbi:FOG: Transposon-encoded proteins with TYA, reverse transcriptase, integrase domains in various combinations [Plasmopara halstedii]|uniref:FOG: Transposon-encoded proteins with TYA, reverse transcriptase, integrase domains in various combinations n=1 Tax=Plasmopara halstedii TaxID=4781 RepID=A0A0P1AJB2_PLAHL|nr:FOG: Transposon-encoded proteins with TYA, reverse transcriptase, integrase domains in various combinations [Plasmopara halstedii]CEG41034.1 FOG: Transposon-encoded proteins with TYA, reverse transcriptase, integrase domains in various combinations [Plasmopara halstedii]|eukprot:XP_024577403.1 FOG: Transposon-encoded proteins with TYA, reverse transcriptase, integrase domains in various combinations [Plasmopara halstedii]